jgi:serine/threonine protein phosphatase PrpC
MLNVVNQHDSAGACAELVKIARQRGGPDNITVQILRLSSNGTPRQ